MQFGFLDQDIVIYKNLLPAGELGWLKFWNSKKKDGIRLPLVIIELKLGVNSHELITYSKIADNIKQIFPWVKYYMLIRGTTKDNEVFLKRHERFLDGIFKLESKIIKTPYVKGELQQRLEKSPEQKEIFDGFLGTLRLALSGMPIWINQNPQSEA